MIIFAFTDKGQAIASKISTHFNSCKVVCNFKEKSLKEHVSENFYEDCLVFVGAVGIAVRAIAPFIKSKQTDPAVICLDEKGEHVIPILSGHLGGANNYSLIIAQLLGGHAVITTATDINNVFAVDVWAKQNDYYCYNKDGIKYVSSSMLKGEKIGFCTELPLKSKLPDFFTNETPQTGICITENVSEQKPFENTLYLIPKNYVLGIGCRKNTDSEIFEKTVAKILTENNIKIETVCAVTSIDLKKSEKAILNFCNKYKIKFVTYRAEELNAVTGEFAQSGFVKSVTGTDNVCERSAALYTGENEFCIKKTAENGITLAAVKRKTEVAFCI